MSRLDLILEYIAVIIFVPMLYIGGTILWACHGFKGRIR